MHCIIMILSSSLGLCPMYGVVLFCPNTDSILFHLILKLISEIEMYLASHSVVSLRTHPMSLSSASSA